MSSLLVPAHGGFTGINRLASVPMRNFFQLRSPAFCGAPMLAFLRVAPHFRLVSSLPRYGRSVTCLFGGKGGASENKDSDATLWKSFENAMANLKNSMDNDLREQIREQELTGGGGSGGPPRGGGGGGDGSGDTEDEGLLGKIDEFFQAFFATLGIIFLYAYMVKGRKLIKAARRLAISTSVRLRYAMIRWKWELRFSVDKWKWIWRKITRNKVIRNKVARKKVIRRGVLERAILSTPTLWQNKNHLQQRKRLRRRLTV